MAFKGARYSTLALIVGVFTLLAISVPNCWAISAFSYPQLKPSPAGIQMVLAAPKAVPSDVSGLILAEGNGDWTSLTFSEDFERGSIQACNAEGVYAQIKIHHFQLTLDELEVGGYSAASDSEDLIYQAFFRLYRALESQKGSSARDSLLQANSPLVILRTDGEIEVLLYHRDGDKLVYMGQIQMGADLSYELNLAPGRTPEVIASKGELSQQSSMVLTFDVFGVSEHYDYSANQFIKWSDEGGLEVTSQAIGHQVLHGLATTEALYAKPGQSAYEYVSGTVLQTGLAALSGGVTGYVIQWLMDAGDKFYSERKLPWDYSKDEYYEIRKRALRTGIQGAVQGGLSNRILTYMTSYRGDFSGAGIRSYRFTGAVAGALASVGTNAFVSGYSYYQGDIDSSELSYRLADASARAVPVLAGSVLGHTLFPYGISDYALPQTPAIGLKIIGAAFGPSLGALVGSIAGNIVYDTAFTKSSPPVTKSKDFLEH